jgi:hypothetical protein
MRAYLAATSSRLQTLAVERRVEGDWEGFAADDDVRAALNGPDDEELEYALSVAASEASAALGGDLEAPGRRFVVVVEVDPSRLSRDPDTPGAVVVTGPIELSEVDAVLASDGPRSSDGGDGEELGWYGVQEIGDLLA